MQGLHRLKENIGPAKNYFANNFTRDFDGFDMIFDGFDMLFDGFDMIFDGFDMIFDGFDMIFDGFDYRFSTTHRPTHNTTISFSPNPSRWRSAAERCRGLNRTVSRPRPQTPNRDTLRNLAKNQQKSGQNPGKSGRFWPKSLKKRTWTPSLRGQSACEGLPGRIAEN